MADLVKDATMKMKENLSFKDVYSHAVDVNSVKTMTVKKSYSEPKSAINVKILISFTDQTTQRQPYRGRVQNKK